MYENLISCKDYVVLEKERIKKLDLSNVSLGIIQVGDNPASNAYVKGKLKDCEEVGLKAKLYHYDEDISQGQLNETVRDNWNTGLIIQLPLPKHLSVKAALSYMPKWKDVDGFIYDSGYVSCTPKGIVDWLHFNKVNLDGANVVIIGRSDIVGKPLARLMLDNNATVTVCHSHTPKETVYEYCKSADIIVVAIGKESWLDFDLKDKLIVDVGINRNSEGKLCGDVDPKLKENNYVTPVPGGVGLLTRISLLKNVVEI